MEFNVALYESLLRLLSLDPDLIEIILLSLRVSLTSVSIAALVGCPLGALLAVCAFPDALFLGQFGQCIYGASAGSRRFWLSIYCYLVQGH